MLQPSESAPFLPFERPILHTWPGAVPPLQETTVVGIEWFRWIELSFLLSAVGGFAVECEYCIFSFVGAAKKSGFLALRSSIVSSLVAVAHIWAANSLSKLLKKADPSAHPCRTNFRPWIT